MESTGSDAACIVGVIVIFAIWEIIPPSCSRMKLDMKARQSLVFNPITTISAQIFNFSKDLTTLKAGYAYSRPIKKPAICAGFV
jgi:hypothetical protein